jgi:hypothetical protein
MPAIEKLASVRRLRRDLLGHVDTMLSVLEELDWPRGGRRTRFLNDESWRAVKRAYDSLGGDFRALLVMGVVLHDVGKLGRWDVHADIGAAMVADLLQRVPPETTDLGVELGIGGGGLPASRAAELLVLLVKHHEVYGNFFTGEQSLLGWEPVVRELRRGPIEKLLDTMMLLTVAEVASQGADGFLLNTRITRYLSASKAVRDWVAANQGLPDSTARTAAREFLISQGEAPEECVKRIVGLAHSYSPWIDQHWLDYVSSVRQALAEEELLSSQSDMQAFAKSFARVRKLAYALRWCEALSGELRRDGAGKSIEGLRQLIRLLWLVTRPASWCLAQRVFEVRFPPVVDGRACSEVATHLGALTAEVDPCYSDIDPIRSKGWQPMEGLLIRVAREDDEEVVLDCALT